jgi:hypothetical protein
MDPVMGAKLGLPLRVFENRVLKRVFGPKRRMLREDGEDCIREVS